MIIKILGVALYQQAKEKSKVLLGNLEKDYYPLTSRLTIMIFKWLIASPPLDIIAQL